MAKSSKASLTESVRAAADQRYQAFRSSCDSPSWTKIKSLINAATLALGQEVQEQKSGAAVNILESILKMDDLPDIARALLAGQKPMAERVDKILAEMSAKPQLKVKALYFAAEAAKANLAALKANGGQEADILQAEVAVDRLEAEIATSSNSPEWHAIFEEIGQSVLQIVGVFGGEEGVIAALTELRKSGTRRVKAIIVERAGVVVEVSAEESDSTTPEAPANGKPLRKRVGATA